MLVWLCVGVIELDKFVEIASATGAGGQIQDDLGFAKLHDLQFVGDAFGPLLFDIPPSSGASELFARWKRVRNSVQGDSKRIQDIIVCVHNVMFGETLPTNAIYYPLLLGRLCQGDRVV